MWWHVPQDHSPDLPLNLGMFDGNLVGTGGHEGSCLTGSFINFDKSGKFKFVRNGSLGKTGVLNVPSWGLEGLAPMFPYVDVGLPPTAGCKVVGMLWKGFHP